uniref:Putative secreted peptide n=1 Tax=Anopheles braziliensis TaxID=58242 RepID=A0A2M3ZVB5_9DIPT
MRRTHRKGAEFFPCFFTLPHTHARGVEESRKTGRPTAEGDAVTNTQTSPRSSRSHLHGGKIFYHDARC